jgi:hypothetical protein
VTATTLADTSRTKALLTLAVTFPDSSAIEGGDELTLAAWWCGRLWGRREGRAVVGLGHGGHYKGEGMAYAFERFEQRSYGWPADCERLLDDALAAAPEVDVYVSVLLHQSGTSGRERATALGGAVAWADVDGDWTPQRQAALDALKVDAWHVESGARGGRHVYVPLGEEVDPDRLEQVNRRLALALDADDGWSRTKVLRLPGTLNHKPRPFGAPSAAVRWLW